MRVRITIRRTPDRPAEPYLFSDVFVHERPRWLPLLSSAIAHGFGLALIPTLLQALAGISYVQTVRATFTLEPLRLELPQHLYSRSAPPQQPKEPAPKPSEAARPAPAPASRPSPAGAGLRLRASLPKQLELPTTQHISDQAPVVLQPDSVPLPTPAMPAAPALAFWAGTNQPRPRRAMTPGRVQMPSVPPNLDAPPVLSPSTPQPVASDIASALAAAQTDPKLALPNASTNPVRIHGKGGTEIASFDVPQSDPVNLIYLMADSADVRQVEIPRGLQNTPRSSADGGTGLTPGGASDEPAKTSSSVVAVHDRSASGAGGSARAAEPGAAGTAASARTSAGAGTAATPGTSRTSAAAGTEAAPGTSRTSAAARTEATPRVAGKTSAETSRADAVAASNAPRGTSPAAEVSPGAHPAAPAGARAPDPVQNGSGAVIRVTNPANGNFDVVVLQSVALDDLPGVGRALSGNPVYTVYLSVGDARDWLLEYCIPANVSSRASSFQVNIDDPGVVSAPYPLSTVIPRNVFDLPHPQHIVLHGLLSTGGTFREVKAPDMENPLVREVLPLLSQWEFRPALRDKVPIEVEVLLIIPPRS